MHCMHHSCTACMHANWHFMHAACIVLCMHACSANFRTCIEDACMHIHLHAICMQIGTLLCMLQMPLMMMVEMPMAMVVLVVMMTVVVVVLVNVVVVTVVEMVTVVVVVMVVAA